MPILTRAELEARIGSDDIVRLADRDDPAGEDAGAVQAAIDDAEHEVLAYVRKATSAPIHDPAPPVLKRLVAVIARYNLWRRDVPVEHSVYIAYKDAIRELQAIAAGQVALLFDDGGSPVVSLGAGIGWAPPRVMTDAALAGMGP
jgi:phage gp36-like protein